ncbi:hypothetical protein A3F65_01655 [Candidatus Saccharibacteria bacterium RIFCSPHIGHO2_12_FULL_47_16b]|nr:MAG: hypothetical protein A3F65_01655 [Candidatus Saccharibacteria bacterium RIFCSPHIGHO2_12_FULL_47_16b]
MYLAVDVGASKTLFAVFSRDGHIKHKQKIKTDLDYDKFLKDVADTLAQDIYKDIDAACFAFPGWFDFEKGIFIAGGRLPWHNLPLKKDLSKLLPHQKILIHNDAKLAALSEAKLAPQKYRKILYLTLSTGIGGGVIVDGRIEPEFEILEPGQMMFDYDGKKQKWESFASGRALFERYGRRAAEIEDKKIWHDYAKLVAMGLQELLVIIRPDLIIFGGGAGGHIDKFKTFLMAELQKTGSPLVNVPPMVKAKRPAEAVIYGCYEYLKANT